MPPSDSQRDPLDLAARALRHRDRSRRQVEERLARAGIDDEARAETLDTLERVGYVDDGRYAAARAADLAGRGYGDEGIRHVLRADGVGADEVEAALATLEAEPARAAAIVARHGASAGTAARLGRKGFAPETVEQALGGALPGFAEELSGA